MGDFSEKQSQKLNLAARAAWLYYVAQNTQDDIATKLHISRQAVQRLVSQAVSEGLIKFKLDHPITELAELAEQLRAKFQLAYCNVTMTDSPTQQLHHALGLYAAEYLESYLTTKTPTTLAFGTGRTMRSMVSQVSAMHHYPQHKLVSIVGNMTHDGRASHFEVVMKLADTIGAQAYFLATPVLTSSVEEKQILQSLPGYNSIRSLAMQAKVVFVGVAEVDWRCPLHLDGFINDAELTELIEHKAVGEIIGWAFDKDGNILKQATNQKIASIPLADLAALPVIAVSGGANKVKAITAALRGKLISGLITDEETAKAILQT